MSGSLIATSIDTDEPGFDIPCETEEWAFVEVRHAGNCWARHQPFQIALDGHPIGSVEPKSPLRFQILAGHYTLAAKLSWVRTQTVLLDLKPGEHAVFACGMIPHLSRIWSIGVVALCVAVVSSITSFTMAQRFPWIEILNMWIMTPCLTVLAICELILFSRMTPRSEPGHVYRLFRNPAGSGRTEDV
jgi:hypothetical protein